MAVAHNHLVAGRWNDDACHKAHSFVCSRMKCEFLGLVSTCADLRAGIRVAHEFWPIRAVGSVGLEKGSMDAGVRGAHTDRCLENDDD